MQTKFFYLFALMSLTLVEILRYNLIVTYLVVNISNLRPNVSLEFAMKINENYYRTRRYQKY